jgi:hypothetical protein
MVKTRNLATAAQKNNIKEGSISLLVDLDNTLLESTTHLPERKLEHERYSAKLPRQAQVSPYYTDQRIYRSEFGWHKFR